LHLLGSARLAPRRARQRAFDQHDVGLRAELTQELRERQPRQQVLRTGRRC